MLYDVAFTKNSSDFKIAFEIPFLNDNNNSNNYSEQFEDFLQRLKNTKDFQADLISIKFNLTLKDFDKQFEYVKKSTDVLNNFNKPLILRGCNNEKLDIELLNFLATNVKKQSIIAFAQEANYREIIPTIIETSHKIVLRTPIDINLAKELNILSLDLGLKKDKILIDTDTGGLGYGLDYGYSMMEKVKLEALKGDEMLDFPIISFIGEEVSKAKELKSDSFDDSWGEIDKRVDLWEITAASSIITANANIVVVCNKNTVKTINEVLK